MKKLIPLAFIVMVLSFILVANAENDGCLSYDFANKVMLEGNRDVKKQELAERRAYYLYRSTVLRTGNIETERAVFDTPFGKFSMLYTPDIQVLLTKQKELLPSQMKLYWMMADKGKILTQKALTLGFRDLFLGFLNADREHKMNLKRLELQERKYEAARIRLQGGLISTLDFEEEEYNYAGAQKAFEISKRTRENMQRNVNIYMGNPADTEYESATCSELTRGLRLNALENYIERALAERYEILSIEWEIEVKRKHLEILTRARADKVYTSIKKEYQKILREIEMLEIKLEQVKYDVEGNIKSAYIDIKKEGYNLNNMYETLDMQKRNFDRLKYQYEQGLISKLMLDELELGLEEIQNGVDLLIYNLNTKIMRIEEASGLGPAY